MSRPGELAGEIQRRSAEIDRWPDWAQPYEPQTEPLPPVQREMAGESVGDHRMGQAVRAGGETGAAPTRE